jgi:hypothetical protein
VAFGWRGGSVVPRQTVVLQSLVRIRRSPKPTADCQSSHGLPPGMALGCEMTVSVRDNRGKIYEKLTIGSPKTFKRKNMSTSVMPKTCSREDLANG